jgi:hypothetical protein
LECAARQSRKQLASAEIKNFAAEKTCNQT